MQFAVVAVQPMPLYQGRSGACQFARSGELSGACACIFEWVDLRSVEWKKSPEKADLVPGLIATE
jgi:hypothetical protein